MVLLIPALSAASRVSARRQAHEQSFAGNALHRQHSTPTEIDVLEDLLETLPDVSQVLKQGTFIYVLYALETLPDE